MFLALNRTGTRSIQLRRLSLITVTRRTLNRLFSVQRLSNIENQANSKFYQFSIEDTNYTTDHRNSLFRLFHRIYERNINSILSKSIKIAIIFPKLPYY